MSPEIPGSGLLILKLGLSLALVVGLILALQRVARRYGGSLGAAPGADQIRLLSQRAVGPRLSLAVIEVQGKTLLVGISPQGIRRVADLGRVEREGRGAAALAAKSGETGAARSLRDLPWLAWTRRLVRPCAPAPAASTGLGPTGSLSLPGLERRTRRTVPVPAGPLAFEQEMANRLSSVRARYRFVSDLEADLEEARRG